MKTCFLHVPKVAGNTILAATKPDYRLGHGPCWKSMEAFKNKSWKTTDTWDSVFKFAFLRNPWDRMVSQFFHTTAGKTRHGDLPVEEAFRRWLSYEGMKAMQTQAPTHSLWFEGKLQVDFLGQFEHLREGLDKVAKITGRPLITLAGSDELQVVNHGKNRPGHGWEQYYDERSRDAVEALHLWDIRRFGYRFADPSSRS